MGYKWRHETAIEAIMILEEGSCDRCGASIKPVFENMTSRQLQDASVVEMQGWYGGYIDPLTQEEEDKYKWVLCYDCSKLFVKFFMEGYDADGAPAREKEV